MPDSLLITRSIQQIKMMSNDNRRKLVFEDKEITLIGTAHVSRKSVEFVKKVIEEERPETVCIELCDSRYQVMTEKKKWQDTDIIKVLKEKKAFLLLSNLILSSFQKKIGRKLGVKPGEEIIKAIESAEAIGAGIYPADRDIKVTLSRAWRLMGLWTKIKLIFQIVVSFVGVGSIEEEDIEKMKNKDILEALLSEIGDVLPELRRILIDERDRYLAFKIKNAPGKKIVAVVGAGHVPGIQSSWQKQVDINALNEIPPKSKVSGFFKWAIPVLVVGLVIFGFFNDGIGVSANMIKWWVLSNALFAGVGATAALANPITVLSAIVASPLTSLNPMIAAGWVAGMVEIFLEKPKVKDFEGLGEDILSLKGFWKNKITRILLVVVFTNIGSSLGTFVAIPLMARVFV